MSQIELEDGRVRHVTPTDYDDSLIPVKVKKRAVSKKRMVEVLACAPDAPPPKARPFLDDEKMTLIQQHWPDIKRDQRLRGGAKARVLSGRTGLMLSDVRRLLSQMGETLTNS